MLPGWEGPVVNAARWLREYYEIPDYEMIEDKFCEHFKCEIHREMMEPPYQESPAYSYAVFDEHDATMFILRWS